MGSGLWGRDIYWRGAFIGGFTVGVLEICGKFWENGVNSDLQPDECLHSKYGKLYIFGKKGSPFQKYIVFHWYYEDIHPAVISISPIFPIFPSMLIPFLQIPNKYAEKGTSPELP